MFFKFFPALMSKTLVKSFNALPRNPKAPSGFVPNEWHFDIRYIQIEPTPSHVLFLLQPQSQFVHLERLPLGLSPGASGLTFFPETGREAAPELVKGLLHSFVNNLGLNRSGEKIFGAPWKLSTEDRELAEAVGEEVKRLGVRAEALWTIGVSSPRVNGLAQTAFENYFGTLKKSIGINDLSAAAIVAPDSIIFSTFKADGEPQVCVDMSNLNAENKDIALAMNYVQLRAAASPVTELEPNTKRMLEQQQIHIQEFYLSLDQRTEAIVRAEADAGDPEALAEYGLRYASHYFVCAVDLPLSIDRLYLGVACTRNRTLSRVYFLKALSAPNVTDTLKAMTHGLLIDWYISASKESRRARYLYAASHHANISARLCRLVSPKGAPSSPLVFNFMISVFEPCSKQVPELYYFYKDAVRAMQERAEQMRLGGEKLHIKRMKQPNRYRCATPGCAIEADTGAKLSQCVYHFHFLIPVLQSIHNIPYAYIRRWILRS